MKFFKYVFFAAFIALASCSTDGEDGADGMDGINGIDGVNGQDGQNGADGMDGANGMDGQDGQDGQDGSANVISSGWIDYDINLWGDLITQFTIDQRLYPVEIPDFTEEMADTAAILMYTRFGGTDSYILPFVENITAGDTQQELSFQPRRFGGGIDIRMVNITLMGDPGTFGAGNEYRYVIIPAPGKSANFSPEETLKYYEDLGVDFSDLASVQEYFDFE